MVKLHKEAEDATEKEGAEKVVSDEAKTAAVETVAVSRFVSRRRSDTEARLKNWVPKTGLGRSVMNHEITSIEEIFRQGLIIREPEIVDYLVPDLEEEVVLTGGMPGKGGGKMKTAIRITTRMHKSGRKRRLSAFVIIGNKNGIIGYGYASGKDARSSIEKATQVAKVNIVQIRRGCGSWECACKQPHSIPFKIEGKGGSVKVKLLPAPRGLGLCAAEEPKKLFRLAGIKDIWVKSTGMTSTRLNFVMATFNALVKLNKMKVDEKTAAAVGLKEGTVVG